MLLLRPVLSSLNSTYDAVVKTPEEIAVSTQCAQAVEALNALTRALTLGGIRREALVLVVGNSSHYLWDGGEDFWGRRLELRRTGFTFQMGAERMDSGWDCEHRVTDVAQVAKRGRNIELLQRGIERTKETFMGTASDPLVLRGYEIRGTLILSRLLHVKYVGSGIQGNLATRSLEHVLHAVR
ncbi:hypothetical protein CTI12_AA526580 [Artemisia annua]|uniref:Uncharacterized protein n=1 Tax=Artemisia annua TaxID=35608 RepID=A0A2U1L5Z2_ARTAN|nr:hypothetical protein CTI12_AA526580 [Artemisia annua]